MKRQVWIFNNIAATNTSQATDANVAKLVDEAHIKYLVGGTGILISDTNTETPTINLTSEASIALMQAHMQNTDKYLDEGGANEVSAEDLKLLNNTVTPHTDGTAELPNSTIENINTRGAKAVVTKEYVENNAPETPTLREVIQAGSLLYLGDVIQWTDEGYTSELGHGYYKGSFSFFSQDGAFIALEITADTGEIKINNYWTGGSVLVEVSADNKLILNGVTQEDYTTAEKNKLASIDAAHYGAPLQTLVELSALAEYADKERRYVEDELSDYFYDATATAGDVAPDNQTGGVGFWRKVAVDGETAASIKTKYESNPDTNAFTDAKDAKLTGIEAGAQVNVAPTWAALPDKPVLDFLPTTGGTLTGLLKGTAIAASGEASWSQLVSGRANVVIYTFQDTTGRLFAYDGANYYDLAIGDWGGGNPNIMLKKGGNVGLGKGNPTEKLDVAGNIALSGTIDGVDLAAFKSLYDAFRAATEIFTTAEKNKLASIDAAHYGSPLQTLVELSALTGYVDKERRYVEDELSDYFYDATATTGDVAPDDQTGGVGFWRKVAVDGETSASIKSKYESNPDTNAFTDSEKTKLTGIEAGAQVNVAPTWNAVDGKPTEFPPSAHNHTINQVTNLQADLDNRFDKTTDDSDDVDEGLLHGFHSDEKVRESYMLEFAGTVFPSAPNMGQPFFRTDLGEQFFADTVRGYWLSTNQISDVSGGSNATTTGNLSRINGTSGIPITAESVVVGIEVQVLAAFTGDFQINDGATLKGSLSLASETSKGKFDLNILMPAGARMVTSVSVAANKPVCTVYYRKAFAI